MVRSRGTSEHADGMPTMKGGGKRLLDLLAAVVVVGALLLAWKIDVDRQVRLAELEESVSARNDLMLTSKAAALAEYFESIRTVLDVIASDMDVHSFNDEARHDAARVYDILWERHQLSTLHITPYVVTGLPMPIFSFTHGGVEPAAPADGSPPLELLVERDHLDAFWNDPSLYSAISPRITLCGDMVGTERRPGLVFSVPIRQEGDLLGLVAVSIPEERVRELLGRGQKSPIMMFNSRNEVYSSGPADDPARLGLESAVAKYGVEQMIGGTCPAHGQGQGTRKAATEVQLPDTGRWWLAHQYDAEAQVALAANDGPLDGRGFPILVVLTGLITALALWMVRRWMQTRFESLQRQAADEQVLQTVAEGTMGETGEAYFRGLARSLAETFDATFAFVGRVDPDSPGHGDTLAFWDGESFTSSIHYVIEGTPSAEVMRRGRFFCPDNVQDLFPEDDLLASLGVRSYHGVTLYDSDGQHAGIMSVMNRRPMNEPSPRVQSFLQIFAARASAEIIRLRSESSIRQLNADLERRVESRTAELRSAQEQLVEAETMGALGALVSGVAHEINTPVGVGVTAVTHLQDQLDVCRARYDEGDLTRTQLESFLVSVRETADLVYTNLKRAADLVAAFKQVAVDQNAEETKVIHVRPFLEEQVATNRALFEQRGHRLVTECSDTLKVQTWPGALARVVTQLLSNALVHGYRRDEKGTVTLKVECNGPSWKLIYEDDGVGMDPETVGRIYEPFYTTRRGSSGTGLGMHIVYNTVTRTLGGTIRCESRIGRGTRFEIVCPHKIPVEQLRPLNV